MVMVLCSVAAVAFEVAAYMPFECNNSLMDIVLVGLSHLFVLQHRHDPPRLFRQVFQVGQLYQDQGFPIELKINGFLFDVYLRCTKMFRNSYLDALGARRTWTTYTIATSLSPFTLFTCIKHILVF